MNKDLKQTAIEIIENNQYMTLASSSKSGEPWASPVAYVYDSDYTFYWVSVPQSKHQTNIKDNPNIVMAIFDSHQLWGEGVGVQIEAKVEEVSLLEMPKVATLYFSRKYPYGDASGVFGKGLQDLLKGKIYLFYKAIPTRFWVPDPNSDVDSRAEVILKS